jgi:hypothetical protein
MRSEEIEGGKQQSPKTKKLEVTFYPYGHCDWSLGIYIPAEVHKVEGIDYSIRVTMQPGEILNEFDFFTQNQKNMVIAEMERQIDKRGKGNVPRKWRKLLHTLKYGKDEEVSK